MDNINGIPYTTAEFDQDGQRLKAPVIPDGVTDVIIVSHGWNNDREAAENLYRTLFEHVASLHVEGTEGMAIVGVIWPSKKFDFSGARPVADNGQIRAASMNGRNGAHEQRSIDDDFARFESLFADSPNKQELGALRALLGQLDTPHAQAEFVLGLRRLVAMEDDRSDFDSSHFFFEVNDPRDVFTQAMQSDADIESDGQVGADDINAAGIGDVLGGVSNAVSSLLNITTYYEMKKRAGVVGARGLAPLIDEIAAKYPTARLHLVGHSFGARLVTAAAMQSTTKSLHAMFLLQAAFSHNAFSDIGYFRNVVENKRLSGPIVITHTANDTAVGKSYAIASRISGDHAAGLGDRDDKYGGLGCNGARNMGEGQVSTDCRELLEARATYRLQNGLIHNLESTRFIRDHSDVKGKQVAWVISQGIAIR